MLSFPARLFRQSSFRPACIHLLPPLKGRSRKKTRRPDCSVKIPLHEYRFQKNLLRSIRRTSQSHSLISETFSFMIFILHLKEQGGVSPALLREITYPELRRYRADPYPQGTQGKRRRRWRCGSSCQRSRG